MRQEEEEREIDENKIIILNQQLQRNRSVSKIPDYYKDMKDRGRERERVRKRGGGGQTHIHQDLIPSLKLYLLTYFYLNAYMHKLTCSTYWHQVCALSTDFFCV